MSHSVPRLLCLLMSFTRRNTGANQPDIPKRQQRHQLYCTCRLLAL